MKSILYLALGATALINPPLFVTTASAQTQPQVCMAKTKGKEADGRKLTVVVKKSETAKFEARGFSKVSCKGTTSDHSTYKREICRLARIAPVAVQQNFSRIHGISPIELCNAAG